MNKKQYIVNGNTQSNTLLHFSIFTKIPKQKEVMQLLQLDNLNQQNQYMLLLSCCSYTTYMVEKFLFHLFIYVLSVTN